MRGVRTFQEECSCGRGRAPVTSAAACAECDGTGRCDLVFHEKWTLRPLEQGGLDLWARGTQTLSSTVETSPAAVVPVPYRDVAWSDVKWSLDEHTRREDRLADFVVKTKDEVGRLFGASGLASLTSDREAPIVVGGLVEAFVSRTKTHKTCLRRLEFWAARYRGWLSGGPIAIAGTGSAETQLDFDAGLRTRGVVSVLGLYSPARRRALLFGTHVSKTAACWMDIGTSDLCLSASGLSANFGSLCEVQADILPRSPDMMADGVLAFSAEE